MKLRDVIATGFKIAEGKSQLFIAEIDFDYNGLPILKDSLVYYDGKSELRINMVEFALFKDKNLPGSVSNKLPYEEKDMEFLVDRCSSCKFEIDKLQNGWRGIWHNDHFDEWKGEYLPYAERINEMPTLRYSDITFSPVMYTFNTLTNSLVHFISKNKIKLKVNGTLMELPELAEIEFTQSHVTILAINKEFEYLGLKFRLLTLEDGVLSGMVEEKFEAEIFGYSKAQKTTFDIGATVEITQTGDMVTGIYNHSTYKVEKFKIKKCN